MGYFVLENNNMPVSGEVRISGAKNAVLPIMAASVLCERVVLHNCPVLSDTYAAAGILKSLGFGFSMHDNTAVIERKVPCGCVLPPDLCGKMRSSVLFLAPLAARAGTVAASVPGGCCLGARPIDMHLSALEKMGADIGCSGCDIFLEAKNGLKGADIHFDFPSVGATETAVIAAAAAKGKTRIFNPAMEPEVKDLCDFLNAAGAKINFGDVIEIEGVEKLADSVEYTVMPDRIEAGTYMLAAAVTGGELFLRDTVPEHLDPLICLLCDMGCIIKCDGKSIYIDAPKGLENPCGISTAPYPMLPTDLQPQLTALFAVKRGVCTVRENIFEGRDKHIPQLNKMGADIIRQDSRTFVVNGRDAPLDAAVIKASDLRCGAALVLAALTARGSVVIENGDYILRGYEDICEKMSMIGVKMVYKA